MKQKNETLSVETCEQARVLERLRMSDPKSRIRLSPDQKRSSLVIYQFAVRGSR